MDWTKITNGKGDDGHSYLLFQSDKTHKSEMVFRMLALGENAKTQLGEIRLRLTESEDAALDRDPSISHLMEHWEDCLITILGAFSTDCKKLEKYRKTFNRLESYEIDQLDKVIHSCGKKLNEKGSVSGWRTCDKIDSPAEQALHEFTSRIRLFEQSVYEWLRERLSLHIYFNERAYLNRLSKAGFVLAVLVGEARSPEES